MSNQSQPQWYFLRLRHRSEMIDITCWRCDCVYPQGAVIIHGTIVFSPSEVSREEFEESEHPIHICTTCASEIGAVDGFRVDSSYHFL